MRYLAVMAKPTLKRLEGNGGTRLGTGLDVNDVRLEKVFSGLRHGAITSVNLLR